MENLNQLFKKFDSSPDADWRIIFVSVVVFAVLVCALNVVVLMKVNRGEIFTVGGGADEVQLSLNVEELKATVKYYQNKALEFNRIKNSTSTIPDPSF